jgi:uncharacterized protein (TIGR03790 family)
VLLATGLATGLAMAAEISPGARVLLVVNDNSPVSRSIGEYYSRKRGVPATNQCHVKAPVTELIRRPEYDQLAAAIGECLRNNGLVESVYYIVTTLGVPLKIDGKVAMNGDAASVDSELTLLYQELKGAPPHHTAGSIPNPFYNRTASDIHGDPAGGVRFRRRAGHDRPRLAGYQSRQVCHRLESRLRRNRR